MLPQLDPCVGFSEPDDAVTVPRRHRSPTAPEGLLTDVLVEVGQLLLVQVCDLRVDSLARIDNVLLQQVLLYRLHARHLLLLELRLDGLVVAVGLWVRADVAADDVVRKPLVLHRVRLISQDTKDVEAAEDGIRKVHVLGEGALGVVPPLGGVGHRNDGTPRLQCGDDAGLGDGDRLLFHGLMDGRAVLVVHLVELVDETDAFVGQDHGATLEAPVSVLVAADSSCQPDGTGALASGVDRTREGLLHVLQELGLCQARVAHDECVKVAANTVLPSGYLTLPAHHAKRDGRLYVPHAVDGGCHGRNEALTNVWALRKLQYLLRLVVRNLDEPHVTLAVRVQRLDLCAVDWEAGACVCRRVIEATIDASQVELVTWADGVHLVASDNDLLGPGHLPWLHGAGALLQRDPLPIRVERLLAVHTPRTPRLALDARAWSELLVGCHIERAGGEAALCTPQVKALHLVGDASPLRDNAMNTHELRQVLRAQLPDGLAHGEGVDGDAQLFLI
mmetsp:Transcript_87559/g.283480  ORF Transcript_87559/g.283480 Transcript_87559/m.283480 type:complete len:505 (-) Transcript_87559:852-2366(-)